MCAAGEMILGDSDVDQGFPKCAPSLMVSEGDIGRGRGATVCRHSLPWGLAVHESPMLLPVGQPVFLFVATLMLILTL